MDKIEEQILLLSIKDWMQEKHPAILRELEDAVKNRCKNLSEHEKEQMVRMLTLRTIFKRQVDV